MSQARVALHAMAVLVPLVITYLADLLLVGPMGDAVVELGAAAVASTQLACLLSWPLVDCRVRRGKSTWWLGALLALITHVGFSLCFILLDFLQHNASPGDLDVASIGWIVVVPIAVVGWLSFPIAMFLTHYIARLRREELRHAVA